MIEPIINLHVELLCSCVLQQMQLLNDLIKMDESSESYPYINSLIMHFYLLIISMVSHVKKAFKRVGQIFRVLHNVVPHSSVSRSTYKQRMENGLRL